MKNETVEFHKTAKLPTKMSDMLEIHSFVTAPNCLSFKQQIGQHAFKVNVKSNKMVEIHPDSKMSQNIRS